jgi:hypothetical protein
MKRHLIFLMLSACSVCALADNSREIPFKDLHRDWHSGVEHTSIVELHSQSEWEELWRSQHDGETGPSLVDFDTHFVVAFYLGSRPSGGYSVEIMRIAAAAGKATLHATETTPGRGCMVTTSLATPYHYVAVARQTETMPLDFSLTRTIHECR